MRASLEELKLTEQLLLVKWEKDEAPQLYNGEVFGNKDASDQNDIAVDSLNRGYSEEQVLASMEKRKDGSPA